MENLYPIGLPDAIYNDNDFKAAAARLVVLAGLKDVRLLGGGHVVAEAAIRRTSDIVTELWQRKLLPPTIYAIEEGGLQLEWHWLKEQYVEVEVQATGSANLRVWWLNEFDGPLADNNGVFTENVEVTDIIEVLKNKN